MVFAQDEGDNVQARPDDSCTQRFQGLWTHAFVGHRSYVGFGRSWISNVPQGLVNKEVSWADIYGVYPRCSRTQKAL